MKRLLLLTVIIIMVFSFSSCEVADWFLGVMYPEGGDNNISVSLGSEDYFDVNTHPIIIALIPLFVTDAETGKYEVDTTRIVQEEFWQQHLINWDFRGLDSNAYRVIAYYDADDNRMISQNDPSISFGYFENEYSSQEQVIFDFTDEDSPTDIDCTAHLYWESRIDSMLLGVLTGTSSGTTYDLQVSVYSGSTYGYCALSLQDATMSNELLYNLVYLDSNGDGYAYFWGIIDPPGADQKVVASFYNLSWGWERDEIVYINGEGTTGFQIREFY